MYLVLFVLSLGHGIKDEEHEYKLHQINTIMAKSRKQDEEGDLEEECESPKEQDVGMDFEISMDWLVPEVKTICLHFSDCTQLSMNEEEYSVFWQSKLLKLL